MCKDFSCIASRSRCLSATLERGVTPAEYRCCMMTKGHEIDCFDAESELSASIVRDIQYERRGCLRIFDEHRKSPETKKDSLIAVRRDIRGALSFNLQSFVSVNATSPSSLDPRIYYVSLEHCFHVCSATTALALSPGLIKY